MTVSTSLGLSPGLHARRAGTTDLLLKAYSLQLFRAADRGAGNGSGSKLYSLVQSFPRSLVRVSPAPKDHQTIISLPYQLRFNFFHREPVALDISRLDLNRLFVGHLQIRKRHLRLAAEQVGVANVPETFWLIGIEIQKALLYGDTV